jgi:hypothetical protein
MLLCLIPALASPPALSKGPPTVRVPWTAEELRSALDSSCMATLASQKWDNATRLVKPNWAATDDALRRDPCLISAFNVTKYPISGEASINYYLSSLKSALDMLSHMMTEDARNLQYGDRLIYQYNVVANLALGLDYLIKDRIHLLRGLQKMVGSLADGSCYCDQVGPLEDRGTLYSYAHAFSELKFSNNTRHESVYAGVKKATYEFKAFIEAYSFLKENLSDETLALLPKCKETVVLFYAAIKAAVEAVLKVDA